MTGWRPTAAFVRLVVLAFVPLVTGLVAGRADVVILAGPFVLGGLLATLRPPPAAPRVTLRPPPGNITERSRVELDVELRDDGGQGYDAVVVRFVPGPQVGVAAGDARVAIAAPPGSVARHRMPVQVLRWGRPQLGTVTAVAYADDLLLQSAPVSAAPVALTVVPSVEVFSGDDAMPDAAGLVGVHRSRRRGDGGELAGVRAYTPGDRLRRIDWRTSLRTGDLHVAETLSDRDADLVILLDLLHEAGTGAGSVVDTTVHAAADLATHYLDTGDRVSLQEFGASSRRLRAASGRRHRLVLLEWLLEVRPATSSFDVDALIRSWPPVPRTSLVVILTPLLDERSAAVAAMLARGGRTVVAVDTLPAGVTTDRPGRWADVAFRLGMLERADGIARLLDHGVPTVPWSGAGSLDLVLRELTRHAVHASHGGVA